MQMSSTWKSRSYQRMGTWENTEHRDKHHAQQGVCIRGKSQNFVYSKNKAISH